MVNNISRANSAENVSSDAIISLIRLRSTLNGEKSKYNEILEQKIKYESELNELIKLQPKLADLKRDVALSEAVISAALANIEYSESNFYEGYPQIQVIEEPKPEMYKNTIVRVRFIVALILTLLLALIGISLHHFRGIDYYQKAKKLVSDENK